MKLMRFSSDFEPPIPRRCIEDWEGDTHTDFNIAVKKDALVVTPLPAPKTKARFRMTVHRHHIRGDEDWTGASE